MAEYGEESWELDALEPQYIEDLIRDEILSVRDEQRWERATAKQERERGNIQDVIDRWADMFKESDEEESEDDGEEEA